MKNFPLISKVKAMFESFTYPETCCICTERIFSNKIICEFCFEQLHLISEEENFMYHQHYLSEFFNGVFIAVNFDEFTKPLLHQLKYKYGKSIGEWMGTFIADYYISGFQTQKFDAIIPCPLHAQKEKEREYNQAELISTAIAKRLNVPLDTTCLKRTKYTKTQTKFTKKERETNLNGAFSFSAPRRYHKILIVDDVCTTGTTMNLIAKTIINASPETQCYAAAFATPLLQYS